jgi:hypothetical protein
VAGEDLEEVPVGVLEVDAAPAVAGVDLAGIVPVGIGPVGEPPLLDAPEDLVELALADEEGVVLGGDVAVTVDEVEGDVVVDLHPEEGAEGLGLGEAEDLGHEGGRDLLVAGGDDGVIQLNGHGRDAPSLCMG